MATLSRLRFGGIPSSLIPSSLATQVAGSMIIPTASVDCQYFASGCERGSHLGFITSRTASAPSAPRYNPSPNDLQMLIKGYSNEAIARACGVKETTVRKWLLKFVLQRHSKITHYGQGVPREMVESIRKRASRRKHQRSTRRLSSHRVSQIISAIGKTAGVIVRQPDEETGQRIKFASAHDLRRSLAQRLINSGVSAETLMVIMRHKSFATTKKFYAASRAAQSAAAEIHE